MKIDCANPTEVGRFEIRRAPMEPADGQMPSGEVEPPSIATLSGYAAKFNTRSEMMFGFVEQVAPGAFDSALDGDTRALFNHDPNLLLGRTTSGTCRISVDGIGLRYEVDLPDTQYAEDLAKSVERGDVTQSSFAFHAIEDVWEENPDGSWTRTILKVDRLYDVSPVTYPAYPDATVGMRSAMVAEARSSKAARLTDEQKARAAVAAAARSRTMKIRGI